MDDHFFCHMRNKDRPGLFAGPADLSGLPVSYAAEFEWGNTASLKEELDTHVKFPATGKVIKIVQRRVAG
jgi:hypothetical protein